VKKLATMIIGFGILYLIGDTVSTSYALTHGATEMNPAMRLLIPSWIAVVLVKSVMYFALFAVSVRIKRTIAIPVLGFLNISLLLVVLQNFHFFS